MKEILEQKISWSVTLHVIVNFTVKYHMERIPEFINSKDKYLKLEADQSYGMNLDELSYSNQISGFIHILGRGLGVEPIME